MYFEIKVQARSPEELAKRVADNESRGFVVARYYDYERSYSRVTNSKYTSGDGVKRRVSLGSSHKHYGAVMRRENRDWVAQ